MAAAGGPRAVGGKAHGRLTGEPLHAEVTNPPGRRYNSRATGGRWRNADAAGVGAQQLDQRAEGDVDGRRARSAPRAHRRRRRVRRPGHAGIRRTQSQSPDSDGRGRGRGGLGIERLRALSGGALRRRPAVARRRAAARRGRHVDGLAGLDSAARHDRGVLGPDPHARGRARLPEDRGGRPAARQRPGRSWNGT